MNMKNVILSADNELCIYSVPGIVADNLRQYAIEFADNWLVNSPHAKMYRENGVLCYGEADFIEYLNTWAFPHADCRLVKRLDDIWTLDDADFPDEYKNLEYFNF